MDSHGHMCGSWEFFFDVLEMPNAGEVEELII